MKTVGLIVIVVGSFNEKPWVIVVGLLILVCGVTRDYWEQKA